MSTKLSSRSDDSLSSRSRSNERSESAASRSTRRTSSDSESQRNRSISRSTNRSSSRSSSRSGSRSRSSSTLSESSSKRSVATSASSKPTVKSKSRNTSSNTWRNKSVDSEDLYPKNDLKTNNIYDAYNSSNYHKSKRLQWKKKEPSFKPRYPNHGLNAIKIEGVRRDTFDYYIHRRKLAEVKSMVDNRPPQIYPHIYYDMKKLRKRQEEQAMIQRNNHRLLSKLVVAMTTTRIDNVPKNREAFIRNKEKEQKRVERLMGSSKTKSSTNSLPRVAN